MKRYRSEYGISTLKTALSEYMTVEELKKLALFLLQQRHHAC